MQKVLSICVALCVVEFIVADPLHPGINVRRTQARDVQLDAFPICCRPRSALRRKKKPTRTSRCATPTPLLPEEPSRPTLACFVLIDDDFPQSARLEEYGTRRCARSSRKAGTSKRSAAGTSRCIVAPRACR